MPRATETCFLPSPNSFSSYLLSTYYMLAHKMSDSPNCLGINLSFIYPFTYFYLSTYFIEV